MDKKLVAKGQFLCSLKSVCCVVNDPRREAAARTSSHSFTDLTMEVGQADSESLRPQTEPRESSDSIPTTASDSLASDHSDDLTPARSATTNEPTNEPRRDEARRARTLSHRKSHASGHEGEDWAQIERLISRMFGHDRKANSEEEKTRHAGVAWRNLTVKGVGLGAVLQPTNGDIFLGLPRLIKRLLTRGRKGTGAGRPEIRTILDDFTVGLPYISQQGIVLIVE